MKHISAIVFIMFAAQLLAQSAIADGTILPVHLNSSPPEEGENRAGGDCARCPGRSIAVRIGDSCRRESDWPRNGCEARERSTSLLRFDTLVVSGRRISITTNLRALASMMEVEEAQFPSSGPIETPENAWTTDQIGGEVVYRGGGPVANGLHVVGEPTPNGVLRASSGKPGTRCQGEIGKAMIDGKRFGYFPPSLRHLRLCGLGDHLRGSKQSDGRIHPGVEPRQ